MMSFDPEHHNLSSQATTSNFLRIDTPESFNKLRKRGYFYGNSSRKFSMSLSLPNKNARVFFKNSLKSATKSKKAPFLKQLQIQSLVENMTSRDEVKLTHLLRKSKYLQEFWLEKMWNVQITQRFLHTLSKRFSKLYSLQKVKLDLYASTDISTKTCKSMARALSRSRNIQLLDLRMVGCNSIGTQGVHYLLNRFSKLKNLDHLHLDFSNMACFTREESPRMDFENVLSKLTWLKSLRLNMTYDGRLGDEGATSIAKAITNIKGLKKLELPLGCCNITNQGAVSLGEALYELNNLEELSIELWGNQGLTDEGVGSVCKSIGGLLHLKELELNLTNCQEISDEGFSAIVKSLSDLRDLQGLSLALFRCEKLTEVGVFELGRALMMLHSLRKLILNLASCPNISPESLNRLKDSLLLSNPFIKKDNIVI